jgi:hypothetical protein
METRVLSGLLDYIVLARSFSKGDRGSGVVRSFTGGHLNADWLGTAVAQGFGLFNGPIGVW